MTRNETLILPSSEIRAADLPLVGGKGANLGEMAHAGFPVSPGVVEGVVHVIRDPQRESLAPDEILVAEFTDPGWTPLFINASGLILEVGGALTHGAVVAREYGIPAIVSVNGAMNLRDDLNVTVDAHHGIVMINGSNNK